MGYGLEPERIVTSWMEDIVQTIIQPTPAKAEAHAHYT